MSPLLIGAVAVAWLLVALFVYALCRVSALSDRNTARFDVEARAYRSAVADRHSFPRAGNATRSATVDATRVARYNPVTGEYEEPES